MSSLKAFWISIRTFVAIAMMISIVLLPTGLAMVRGRPNTVAILILNIFANLFLLFLVVVPFLAIVFLPLAIIFWVIALVWACTSGQQKVIVVEKSS